MTDRERTALQDAIERLQRWIDDERAADNGGRIPPFLDPALPALQVVLGDVRAELLASAVLTERQRVEGLSAMLKFTLSWKPIDGAKPCAMAFDRDELQKLAQTLKDLTKT